MSGELFEYDECCAVACSFVCVFVERRDDRVVHVLLPVSDRVTGRRRRRALEGGLLQQGDRKKWKIHLMERLWAEMPVVHAGP